MKSRPGTYVLVLKNHTEEVVQIGRWGAMGLVAGYYIYVGSALGPGGVRSRVNRHWRRDKAKHWHIDYLREIMVPAEAWFKYGEERLEHQWANLFLHRDAMEPAPGFGCSDCRCHSHLFYTAIRPDRALFSRLAGGPLRTLRFIESRR